MLNIVICDDDEEFRNQAEKIIQSYPNAKLKIEVYDSCEQLLDEPLNEKFDIYFLDIDMPGINGIQFAEKIRENNDYAIIIFFTSYKEYMEEVFKVQPFDYLMKPLNNEKTWEVLTRAIRHLNEAPEKFIFSKDNTDYFVSTNDIFYFDKDRRKVDMHGKFGIESFYMDIDTLLQRLGKNFVRIHTSYFINAYYVCAVKKNSVVIRVNNDPREIKTEELKISGKFKKECKNQIFRVLGGKS